MTLLPFAGWAAPSVAITSPAASSVFAVANTVTISGTCSPGVSTVELFYNGSSIGVTVPSAGAWSFKWSPGLLRAAGAQNMVARATRGLRTTDSAPRSFTVDNVPLRSAYGAGGGFWFADDLAYADGATVATWASRINALNWTSSTATMLTASGWPTPAGGKKCVALRVASLGEMNCDALAPLFQGTDPPVTVVLVMQVPSGLGAGTQMWFTATSTSTSTPKWLYQSAGLAQRVAKQTTTLSFSTPTSIKVSIPGQHLYAAVDTGVAVNVWRDSGALMNASAAQALDVANAAINTVNLGVQNNAGSKVNRADMNIRAVAVFPTAALGQAEFQYLLNFCFGNFDQDQYYGDSAQAFELDVYTGQSNTQGLAVSTQPAVPGIRFFFRSVNNWLSDPTALASLAPQGAGPYIGYWYQSAIGRKAASGADVHACGFGAGSTYCNTFSQFLDDNYYSTGYFDEWCRNLETAKAMLGGNPSFRLIVGQGESDSTDVTAAGQYLTNLTTWMGLCEGRLTPGVPIVIIEVNGTTPGQTFAATVQAAQTTFVGGRAHTALNTANQAYVYNTGFISPFHFDETAMLAIGASVGAQVVP